MTTWIRRFHLATTIGGGFTGLAIGLAALLNNWPQLKVLAILLVLAYCLLCVWSISVGFRLAEESDVSPELRFFYLVQIPYFTTPALSFHAGFGFMLYIGTLTTGRNVQVQLGADWNTALFHGDGWLFAVNVVPIIVLWIMRRSNKSLERTHER
jgi:hypothetical protein